MYFLLSWQNEDFSVYSVLETSFSLFGVPSIREVFHVMLSVMQHFMFAVFSKEFSAHCVVNISHQKIFHFVSIHSVMLSHYITSHVQFDTIVTGKAITETGASWHFICICLDHAHPKMSWVQAAQRNSSELTGRNYQRSINSIVSIISLHNNFAKKQIYLL